MAGRGVMFRRINGRIVPIKIGADTAGLVAAGAAATAAVASRKGPRHEIKAKTGAQALGFATNVASGLISGATMFSGWKGASLGFGASVGLDALSASANVASYAGRGHKAERATQMAKWQAINTAAGYGAFAGVLLGTKQGRTKLLEYSGKGLGLLRKFGSKLRVLV